jgi:hypothetical protein
MSELDMQLAKQYIQHIYNEWVPFYNPETEFGQGYLSALHDVCEIFSIPVIRTENSLIFEGQ